MTKKQMGTMLTYRECIDTVLTKDGDNLSEESIMYLESLREFLWETSIGELNELPETPKLSKK